MFDTSSVTSTPTAFGGLADGSLIACVRANECGYVLQANAAAYSSSASHMANYARICADAGEVVWLFNTDMDGERIGNPYAFVDSQGYHSWFSEDQQALPCACYVAKRQFRGTCPAHPTAPRPVSVAR